MARVIIQMGHCFRTSGATGTSGVDADPTEQEFAQAAADTAAAMLATIGHEPAVIIADAPDSAYGPGDLFVAIHCDGSTNTSARGASVGYRTNLGADAAARWKANYQDAGWSGGWRPDNYTDALAGYYGVRKAVAAGVSRAFICECGFLTSPSDEALLSFPVGPDRFARALADTVIELFGGAAPEPAPLPPEDDDDMQPYIQIRENGPEYYVSDGAVVMLQTSATREAYRAAGFKVVVLPPEAWEDGNWINLGHQHPARTVVPAG